MPRVEVSNDLYDKARRRWPESAGRPDFDDFCLGPLAAAVFQCERGFDDLAPESPRSPIRIVVIGPSGLYPPVVFYAMEISVPDGEARRVELLDFTVDDTYFDLIADDPQD